MSLLPKEILTALHDIFKENIENTNLFSKACIVNPWFTESNSALAFESWSNALSEEKISEWCKKENLVNKTPFSGKKVGLILAGNLPLVGLHDVICTLLLGHKAMIKPSSQDTVLIKWVVENLCVKIPALKDRVEFCEGFVKDADAYIGTGSNNSSRYFEYYFKNKPNLIRKNRTSVAIIDDTITDDEIKLLGNDVFNYFGMGCRNVTHLFLSENFNFERLFSNWNSYQGLINHNKYANNYTYHKAILLMNLDKHLDTGFLIMVEREQLQTPVALLGYSFYKDKTKLLEKIEKEKENIQCVVTSDLTSVFQSVSFGNTQRPELWDYADGINTIDFLKDI